MLRIHTFFVPVLVLALVVAGAAKTQAHNKPHKAQPASPPAEVQSNSIVDLPPAPPPTPEQGPSSPPEVSFQNGQLTIVARNSTMSDVLHAVGQKTGAAVDMPTVSSERVVGTFGPGAARDVMAQLLNGSHYDYVLVGSPADPGALEKVVLMARVSGPPPTAPSAQPASPTPSYNEPLPAVPEVDTETQDDTGSESPAMPPEMQTGQDDQSQQPERQQPMVKTPEQLLRELQQQQQLQQQQVEQNQPQQQ